MIGRKPPPLIKVGDELTSKWLNGVRNWAVQGAIVDVSAGLSLSEGPNGTTISLTSIGTGGGFWAKTDGVISARSGLTLGSGTVFLLDVSTTTITVTTDTLSVVNYSSTTGGIPTDTYVFVQNDGFGNWSITAVDCGN